MPPRYLQGNLIGGVGPSVFENTGNPSVRLSYTRSGNGRRGPWPTLICQPNRKFKYSQVRIRAVGECGRRNPIPGGFSWLRARSARRSVAER